MSGSTPSDGLPAPRSPRAGVALLVALALVSVGLTAVVHAPHFGARHPAWAVGVHGLGLVTSFGPTEELLWRGPTRSWLKALGIPVPSAVALTSIAFATIHCRGGPALVAAQPKCSLEIPAVEGR